MKQYKVTDEQKKEFASTYLLHTMVVDKVKVPIYLEGNDVDLEPILEFLMQKELVSTASGKWYEPTKKGHELLDKFKARYIEFLKIFDIYCAVDLGEGCFAFEQYYELSDSEWDTYLNDERWEDLRVTVAEFKGLNPVEFVFMSFLKEGQFGNRGNGWQFDLLLGSIWDEILEICNSALKVDDLSYEDDEELVSGESVMEDIIAQGAELNHELAKQAEEIERERREEEAAEDEYYDDDDYYDDYYVEEVVYTSYYDPFYISPLWAVVLFI